MARARHVDSLQAMDTTEVRALFDRQIRGAHGEPRSSGIVRQTDDEWSGVLWSDLDETTADAAIAEQVRHFSGLGRAFEWKHYSHDQPADLSERLLKAGFVPEDPEALMVAEVAKLPTEPVLPDGVRIERVTDAAGIALMAEAHLAAFGRPSHHTEHLLARMQQAPEQYW